MRYTSECVYIKLDVPYYLNSKIPSHRSFEINTLETCFGYLYLYNSEVYTPQWLWQCSCVRFLFGCVILWYLTMRWKTMWHYKLPTRQHARRTYTRCLLEECCSDNVYNYYYYCCRRRWLRVSEYFHSVHGYKIRGANSWFFSPHCCKVVIFI